MFHCYLIQNATETKTYVGSTVNIKKRLRQHNGEICGGAKYTAGDCWKPAILLSGFTSWSQTLRFEFIWKHLRVAGIKSGRHTRGLQKRLELLEYLLAKEEWSHLVVITRAEIACLLDCAQEIEDLDTYF